MNTPRADACPDRAGLLHTDPILSAAREAAVIAVHRMRHWSGVLDAGAVDSKDGRNNLVTAADAEIEALVRGRLLQLRPADTVVGEEDSDPLTLAAHPAGQEILALLTPGTGASAPASGGAFAASDVSEVSEAVEWHVDPIDGTVNFVRGIEHHCFSVGVRRLRDSGVEGDRAGGGRAQDGGAGGGWAGDGRDGDDRDGYERAGDSRAGDASAAPRAADADYGWVAGLVAAPALDRVWFARAGKAWAAPLAALTDPEAEVTELDGSSAPTSGRVLATGFGYSRERRAQQLAALARVMEEFDDLRRCGSAALDLCMAAEGRVNAYYERGLGVYDFAGGAYIAECAGRHVRRRPDAFGGAGPVSTAAPMGAAGSAGVREPAGMARSAGTAEPPGAEVSAGAAGPVEPASISGAAGAAGLTGTRGSAGAARSAGTAGAGPSTDGPLGSGSSDLTVVADTRERFEFLLAHG